MGTFLLILSTIFFIAAFGIHISAKDDVMSYCGYMSNPLLCSIPWICGFVLAVIPEVLIFKIFWLWMFFINCAVVWIVGPLCTRMFLRRLASGKGAGIDILTALAIGVITLIIGILLQ